MKEHFTQNGSSTVDAHFKVTSIPIRGNINWYCGALMPVVLFSLFMLGTIDGNAQSSSANYTFATSTSGSLTDMSAGTIQLVGAQADDIASPVTNIQFDFWFMGVRYTQFSASSNGYVRLGGTAVSGVQYTLGTVGPTLIAALGSDNMTSTTGKVHYKVIGTAPTRTMVIEFKNMTIIYDSGAGATADGTYQVRLYESTNVVELVYGDMNRNSSMGFGGGLDPQYIGFSTNSTDNTYATYVTGTSTLTTMGGTTSNQYTLSMPIADLTSVADGSRKVFTFSPVATTAPTGLSFTSVTALGMTLNWTDAASDEVGYAIYRSTDGANYTFASLTAANAISSAQSGLAPGTTYFWRVYAVREALSTALSGSQMTSAPGNIVSTGSGMWSSTTADAPWPGGIVPSNSDNVTIANGSTVTIDVTTAVCYSLTVGQGASGMLQYIATPASTLTVGNNVTVMSGGSFGAGAGSLLTHVLNVGGNLTNNGTLDFFTTAGASITFTGAANNTFGGSGGTTDIRTMTINKGTSNANILELNPSNFSVQGTTVDGVPMAFLTLTNGTLKVSGTFTLAGRVFSTAAYIIPATGGFWLNNPNFTVSGQGSSPTNNGLLRLTSGTYNIGTASGNAMGAGAGATFNIEGGTMNVSGRLLSSSAVSYTQSGGIVNITTVGNAISSSAGFGFTSTASTFNMSGGIINLVQASTAVTPLDYSVSGTATVTAGTLQVGTAATATNFNFRIRGNTPALVIDSTTNNKTATFTATTTIRGNVLVRTGTTFNLNGFLVAPAGATFTNRGTVTGTATGSRLYFLGTGLAQTYTGTGVITAPLFSIELDNVLGLTFDPAISNIVTSRIILFNGGLTNAGKLTLGNGGATTGIVQIGNTTTPTAAGIFDMAPTFNLGTGGQTISYLRTTTSYTTGPEINPGRVLTSLTYDDNDVSHSLTLSGGNLSTGTLTLTNGKINTDVSNILTVSGTTVGSVVRTNGYVSGPLERTLPASLGAGSTYLFPIGKSAYTPLELVSPTTNAGGEVVLRAEEFDGATGGTVGTGMMSLNSDVYWEASITSGSGNFVNTTIRLTDAGIGSADAIGKSATQMGSYDFIGGNSVGTPVNTITSDLFTSFSFFVMGVKTPPACVTPTAIMVTGITTTTANVGFSCVSCTGTYIVEYGLPGFTPGTMGTAGAGGTVVTGGSSPIGISGLSANTIYQVYVRQDCGAGSYSTNSTVESFATACSTFSLPYAEDFDGVTTPAVPVCTVVEDLNGANTWVTASVNPRSAPNSLDYNWDLTIPGDDWWFTPGFVLTGGNSYRLSFWYRARSSSFPEALEVEYGTAQNAAGMTTPLFSNLNIVNTTYVEAVIDFTPVSNGTYYIGFHVISNANEWDLHIDDISFDDTPTCLAPTTVAVASVTTMTASVNFISGGSSFIVEYGAPGFTPGTGATPGAGGTVVTGGSSPISLSGLTPETTYDVYVRQVCIGPSYSANSTVAQFQTLCDPTNVPYMENFDAATTPALPICTSREDVNGVETWHTTTSNPNSAPNALIYTYDVDTEADDWFFTAPLILTSDTSFRLTFSYRVQSSSWPEALEVKYGPTATAAAMSGGTLLFSDTSLTNTTYQQFVVDFTPVSNGTYYVGFHVFSDANQWNLFIDDISVDLRPCTNLVANTSDAGAGSLRDIVACASPGTTINFAPALSGQTITLTTGEIVINKDLIFAGLGMTSLTISGNDASRIFNLTPGTSLEIRDMALKDGYRLTNGGALFVEGDLILDNVLLEGNVEDVTPKSMTVTSTATVVVDGNVDLKN